MNNIAKHAKASLVEISLTQEDSKLFMIISDNGIGFMPDKQQSKRDEHKKWGLLNLKERAESIGGKLQIASQPGSGTKITVEIPL